MAASIFVDPFIKMSHRKVSLMRKKPKPRTPFGGGWASALWSDVVGDYREYNREVDESQIFLYRRRHRHCVVWFPLSGSWILSSVCAILAREATVGMSASNGFPGTRVESVSALPMLQRCHILHMTIPARCICLTFGTGGSGRCVAPLRWRKRAFRCGKPS